MLTIQGIHEVTPKKNLPFDQEKFSSTFRGMESLAAETIKSFFASLPELVATIEVAIKNKNPTDLERAAHTLKGTLSNFYAEPSRVLALKLERMGQKKSIQGASVVLKELKAELSKLSKILRKFPG